MKNIFFLLLFSILSFSSFPYSGAPIELGNPGYGGSGCPQGTASVTLGPDKLFLNAIFDEYVVEAGDINGKNYNRKGCNIVIPVHVQRGFSVAIIKMDIRGFAEIPYGGYGRLRAESFFAGRRGPRFEKRFHGGFNNDYLLSMRSARGALIWSACGKDVIIRINTSVSVRTNRRGDDAIATVDRIGPWHGIVYHLQWRRCR